MEDVSNPEASADDGDPVVIEALSREDGKNSTVRVFRNRIEWIKERSISDLPRPKDEKPVIPLSIVRSVKAKKDGPLFSRVLLRTDEGTIVFRMHSPVGLKVRDAIAALVAEGPAPYQPTQATPAPTPAAPEQAADDDLGQLQMLLNDGFITPEQFEAAKAELRSP